MSDIEYIKLTEEQVRARKRRNVAIAFGLLLFIATVYAITVSRMHANNEARKAQEAAENAAAGVVAPASADPSSSGAAASVQAAQ